MGVPKRVIDRISSNLRKFQKILADLKNRDVSESDTSNAVNDMLSDLLGYDRYAEVTREFAVRGTYVDLAVKVDEVVRFLIEVKAIGVDLKDSHVKQAVDYGANLGVEWVVLTNGTRWKVYKILFRQPIDKAIVFDLDLLSSGPKDPEIIECLSSLSKEVFTPSSMTSLLQQRQATSKYSIAALLLGDSAITAVRRELRRLFPYVRIDNDGLRFLLEHEVLKRELVDSDEASSAKGAIKKATRVYERARAKALAAGTNETELDAALEASADVRATEIENEVFANKEEA